MVLYCRPAKAIAVAGEIFAGCASLVPTGHDKPAYIEYRSGFWAPFDATEHRRKQRIELIDV
jgi:hypothetical protein